MRDALPNIDPYYNNLRTGLVMAHQGWDTLVHRDPETFELKPLLATAWRFPSPTVLELDIHQGVKFHDGSDLTAEDVVYTINTVSNPDARVSTPSNYAWIEKAEARVGGASSPSGAGPTPSGWTRSTSPTASPLS